MGTRGGEGGEKQPGKKYSDRLATLLRSLVQNMSGLLEKNENPAARLVGQAQSALLFKLRKDRVETERQQKHAKSAVKGWKARAMAWQKEKDDAVAEDRPVDMQIHPGEPPPGMGFAHLD
jgi:hypothetical protein